MFGETLFTSYIIEYTSGSAKIHTYSIIKGSVAVTACFTLFLHWHYVALQGSVGSVGSLPGGHAMDGYRKRSILRARFGLLKL